jgi:protein O-mannosyl-transferase
MLYISAISAPVLQFGQDRRYEKIMLVRQRRLSRWIPIAIAAAVAVTYAVDLHGPFIFDDGDTVVHNDRIRTLWPSDGAQTAPEIVGRPLVSLSLALNYWLGGLNPFGYHLFNIATHMACALLFYAVVRMTLLMPRWNGKWTADSADWFAGAAALIWALHPIQTEAVSYITQRTETLMSMFLLLMLYALARAAAAGGLRWKLLAVASCAAGMACKEIMIVAPLLAILYGSIFLPPRRGTAGRGTYGALMATWIILPVELWGADLDSKSGYGLKYLNSLDYLKTQAGVIIYYLRLIFWPRGQTIDYFDWPIVHGWSPAILPALILLLLVALTFIACVKRQWPGFLGAWFFLILAPTSSILPIFTEIAAERRIYLPLASVVLLVLAALWRLLPKPGYRATAVAATVLTLAGLTIARNAMYRSSVVIWSDAVAKRPDNARAHYFLARAYQESHDLNRMREENDLALKLLPNFQPSLILQQEDTTRPDTPASLPDRPGA